MKTYIVSRRMMLKYPQEFGIDPEDCRNDDEMYFVFRETALPPEIANEAREVECCVVDDETGLQYEPTMLEFGDVDINQG